MVRLLLIFIMSLGLSACGVFHAYRPDVSQGNIINKKTVAKLRPGMTREDVVKLMGTPVLQNVFDDNTLIYVYTFWPNRGASKRESVRLTFVNNKLTKIQKQL